MRDRLHKLVLAAMFIALGFILPFFTGQIPQIGSMLLPMHIPVLLCGFICGWRWGLAVGFVLPLMRSFMLGSPPLMPIALAMSLELATYGFLSGFCFDRARWQCLYMLYRSLLIAMVGGRIVWGLTMAVLMGMAEQSFTWKLFAMGAFVKSLPGIALQLIVIPAIMLALHRTHLAGGNCELEAENA